MFIDDLLVVLGCLLSWVARSKESRCLYHAVVEPLVLASGEECVAKVSLLRHAVSGVTACTKSGITTLQES